MTQWADQNFKQDMQTRREARIMCNRCETQENMETLLSARKHANVAKRQKTCKRCEAREKLQTLPKAIKHWTLPSARIYGTEDKGGKTRGYSRVMFLLSNNCLLLLLLLLLLLFLLLLLLCSVVLFCLQSKQGQTLIIPNISAVLSDFQTIGEGLVKKIEVLNAWKERGQAWHVKVK